MTQLVSFIECHVRLSFCCRHISEEIYDLNRPYSILSNTRKNSNMYMSYQTQQIPNKKKKAHLSKSIGHIFGDKSTSTMNELWRENRALTTISQHASSPAYTLIMCRSCDIILSILRKFWFRQMQGFLITLRFATFLTRQGSSLCNSPSLCLA